MLFHYTEDDANFDKQYTFQKLIDCCDKTFRIDAKDNILLIIEFEKNEGKY